MTRLTPHGLAVTLLALAAGCGTSQPRFAGPPPAPISGFDAAMEPQWRQLDQVMFEVTLADGDEERELLLLVQCIGHRGCPPGDGIVIDHVRPGSAKVTYDVHSTVHHPEGHREDFHATAVTDTGMVSLRAAVLGKGEGVQSADSEVPDVYFRCGFSAGARLGLDSAARELVAAPQTPERQRQLLEAGLANRALIELLQVVQENEVLADLFWEVVGRPSLWSIVTSFGVKVSVQCDFEGAVPIAPPEGLDAAGLGEGAMRLPFRIEGNGQVLVEGTLDVVEPRGALRCSAGVIAIEAVSPSRRNLRLRCDLVAARRGIALPVDAGTAGASAKTGVEAEPR